jgi:hypothetical protein
MKGCETFQLKPVAHGWADFSVAELIFTLRLAFVAPSVVAASSSLPQFFGFAINMCVAISGCVLGKNSEESLHPDACSGGCISMGDSRPPGALGIDVSRANVGSRALRGPRSGTCRCFLLDRSSC